MGDGEAATDDGTPTLVGFARTLRAAGVDATPDRVHQTVLATGHLDPTTAAASTGPGGSPCAAAPTTCARYDRAFAAYFAGDGARPLRRVPPVQVMRPVAVPGTQRDRAGDAFRGQARRDGERPRGAAPPRPGRADARPSARPVRRLIAALDPVGRDRGCRGGTGRRTAVPWIRGAPCARCCAAAASRCAWSAGAPAHGRVAWSCCVDVSGSMQPYADPFLRFAHAAARAPGGHRGLHRRDPADQGHPRAARPRPVGGAARGVRRGARLERRHPARRAAQGVPRPVGPARPGPRRGRGRRLRRLGARRRRRCSATQMARLPRLAHRVVWANPHRGQPGYAPHDGRHAGRPAVRRRLRRRPLSSRRSSGSPPSCRGEQAVSRA